MSDMILRADTEEIINAGFRTLGAWREATKDTPAGPIMQQLLKDGQSYFIVMCGQISVPQRSPAGWTSTKSTDAMGRPTVTWKANGEIVMAKDAQGNLSRVMQPYDTGFWCVMRWLGDNPPSLPPGVVAVDRATLNPDVLVGLVQIA